MLPNLDALINLKWEYLVERLGAERLRTLCHVDIMGVGYWSNMYDFANRNKRNPEALDGTLTVLGKLNTTRPQTPSLNEHEGGILARQLGLAYPQDMTTVGSAQSVLDAAITIRQKTGLDEIIIHTLHFAVGATATAGATSVWQDYCDNAIKTTGQAILLTAATWWRQPRRSPWRCALGSPTPSRVTTWSMPCHPPWNS